MKKSTARQPSEPRPSKRWCVEERMKRWKRRRRKKKTYTHTHKLKVATPISCPPPEATSPAGRLPASPITCQGTAAAFLFATWTDRFSTVFLLLSGTEFPSFSLFVRGGARHLVSITFRVRTRSSWLAVDLFYYRVCRVVASSRQFWMKHSKNLVNFFGGMKKMELADRPTS